ncbi:MAG: sulfatase-like hydrolase/transferase [Lentisphaeria bacterium]|nr:sulfatase-like hydrolase/transferase [Lentisphaeria bacterium]
MLESSTTGVGWVRASLCLALAAGTGWSAAATPRKGGSTARPNVILCMADDLGWGDVGYNGNPVIRTPHLDRMAADGVRFDRFYAAAPVCSPTRASCLTGRHPYRTGVFFANVGILRPEELTLAEVLRQEGYRTGFFGKWHLGTFTGTERDANRGGKAELVNPPSEHGFETYFATESKVPTWDPMKKPAAFAKPGGLQQGWHCLGPEQAWEPYGTHYWTPEGKATENLDGDDSRVIMDRALPFIERSARAGSAFLAVIWFHAPHLPCVAGPEYAALYRDQEFPMQQYAGCITAMDEQMGRLRSTLERLGIAANTIVTFCSDNGPEGNQRAPGSTGGFRGRKRSLYDGGVRVPGLLVWPARVKPLVTAVPAVTSDYLPTILEALGIGLPAGANRLDGISLLPLLDGGRAERASPIGFLSQNQIAFNGPRYKLYRADTSSAVEIYDLPEDPHEKTNLADMQSEQVGALLAEFHAWMNSCRNSFEGGEYGTASLERVRQSWAAPGRDARR